jgi:hypothetical protein
VSVTAVTRAFEHLTRFSPAQYVVDFRVIRCFLRYNIWLSPELHEVSSGVIRGFLQRGGRPTCNINVRGCSESARFETLEVFSGVEKSSLGSASRLRRAAHDINRQNQHVRRFSPARCEVRRNTRFSPAWRIAHSDFQSTTTSGLRYRQTYGRHLRNRRRSCGVNVRGCSSDPVRSTRFGVFSGATRGFLRRGE